MAEVVYYDGAVDWLAPFQTAGDDHGYAAFLATLGGIVMGRRTYDQVRGFGPWPYTGLDCRVVNSRPLSDTPVRVAPVASPAEAVAGWTDRRVWLVGGTTLLDGFRAARLMREYHVWPLVGRDKLPSTSTSSLLVPPSRRGSFRLPRPHTYRIT